MIYELLSIVLRVFALFVGFYLFENDLFAVAAFALAGVVLNITLISVTIYYAARTDIVKE